ncbi:MAG: TM2 domain-containing protein [Clostridia bacterium]|nr:TM2 domain-containing protein [Clostridia bacterium]
MKELFDLDYLGKDLSGNAEIQSAVDRGLAFMKLEKWEKALQVFEELIDLHPESPCGWFGKSRVVSNDYTIFGLSTQDGRMITAQVSENLDAAAKIIDESRKEDYQKFQAVYAEYLKKDLVESYVASFKKVVDTYNAAAGFIANRNHRLYMVSDIFNMVLSDNDGEVYNNSIYGIPEEIISEVGKDYPSLKFAALHEVLLREAMKPYYEAQNKQAHAKRVQEARFEQRKGWNQRQGFGYSLDRDEVEKLSKECPVYELSHYYKYSFDPSWSLAKLIKNNSVFTDAPMCDENVKDVFKAYFKFFSVLDLPIGDLKDAGVPDKYYQEIEEELQKIEEEQKEQKAKEEHEKHIQQEKEREQAAAKAAEYKSRKWMLVIVCLLFGNFGIHNFMMGETKKGIIKLLLCWTGISSLIALLDMLKLIFDKYVIS